jgi:hypothetical protein
MPIFTIDNGGVRATSEIPLRISGGVDALLRKASSRTPMGFNNVGVYLHSNRSTVLHDGCLDELGRAIGHHRLLAVFLDWTRYSLNFRLASSSS